MKTFIDRLSRVLIMAACLVWIYIALINITIEAWHSPLAIWIKIAATIVSAVTMLIGAVVLYINWHST